MIGNSQLFPEDYLELWNGCPDGVLIVGKQKKIVFANPAAAKLFDCSREEIIDTPLNRIISGELPDWKEKLPKTVLKGEELFKRKQLLEIEGIRKNRSRFPLELSLSFYRGSEGDVFILVILRDTTSQKQAATESRQWADSLDLFFRFVLEISSPAHLDQLLRISLDKLLSGIELRRGMLFILDEPGKRLLLKVHRCIPDAIYRELADRKVNEDPLAVKALSTGMPLVERNINKIDKVYKTLIKPGKPFFFAYCPIKSSDETIGLIVFQDSGIREFAGNDIALLKAVCRILGQAIKHSRTDEETIQRAEELNLLQNINTALNSAAGMDEVLETISGGMVKVFGYSGSLVFLEEEGGGEKIILKAFSYDYDPRIIKKTERLLGFSIKGHEFNHEKDHTISRLYSDRLPIITSNISGLLAGLFHREILKKLAPAVAGLLPVNSVLLVPMVLDSIVKGILVVAAQRELGANDISRVQAFATQATLAVEKAKLFEEERRRSAELSALQEVSKSVSTSLNLKEILQKTTRKMVELFHVDHSGILSFDDAGEWGSVLAEYPDRGATSERIPLKGYAAAERIMAHPEPLMIEDAVHDPLMAAAHKTILRLKIQSMLILPLVLKGKTIGSIGLDAIGESRKFRPEEIALGKAIAGQDAATIENALLHNQLKESEERFLHVTANTGDWVWEVDAEGRYTYSSPVVTQILGYTPQEVLGKHFYDFFIPDDREKMKSKAFETFQKRKPFSAFINRNLHRDGRTVILETSGIPVISPDGQFSGYRGADHDITARLQAEQALASSEHKYRILVEHANDWIWTLDLRGNFTFLNRAAEEATGYKCEEWVGRNFAPVILPEDLPHINQVYSEILAGNSKHYEVRVYDKDKKLITLAVNTAPLYEGGKLIGTVSMGRDITRQKQLENQLRQAQKMETIGTLAGGIAHDFNNILGGILGYTSLIKSEIPANAPLRTEMDAVISLVHRAAKLTEQLLAFAREGRYQIQPINLNDIANEVLKLLSQTIDKAVRMKPVLSPALNAVEGDARQIQQMIMNLCLNASDAMPEGGELLIETGNIDIDEDSIGAFPGLEAGSYVFLGVSDTGIGMDSETKARIFDLFFTTKGMESMGNHSGLGLSMVYGVVESHRGIIKVYSEVGKGTTFKVHLPAYGR